MKKKRSKPVPNEAKASRVYVILKDGGSLKIGISRHPKRRLSSLQAAMPHRLRLFYSILPHGKTAFQVEGEAMAMLAHWRVSGEWFSCSPLIARAAVEAAGTGCDRLRALVALASECHSTRAALERLMAEGRDTIEISAAHTRLCDQLHAGFPEHADEIAPRVRNARAAQLEKRPKLEKMFSSDFTAIFQPIESAA